MRSSREGLGGLAFCLLLACNAPLETTTAGGGGAAASSAAIGASSTAGANSSGSGTSTATTSSSTGGGNAVAYWLAFAADFATGTTCGDEPNGSVGAVGCDIYRAKLDGTTWEASNVERLTDDAVPEVFPTITADGSRVFFHTMASTTARAIVSVEAATMARTTVANNAQYAEVLPDGSKLLFTDLAAGTALTLSPLDAKGALGARTLIGTSKPAQDANVSQDGNHAVFHVPGSGAAHGVFAFDVGAPMPYSVTSASGTGHCTVSPTGSRVVCDDATGKGLSAWDVVDGKATGPTTVVGDPMGLSASDADYASCGTTSVDYPAFCDDSHLVLSVSCVSPTQGIKFSKVYLAVLGSGGATLTPLGAQLAKAYGGPGKTSWTPACRRAK